jgi:hypothetical protein
MANRPSTVCVAMLAVTACAAGCEILPPVPSTPSSNPAAPSNPAPPAPAPAPAPIQLGTFEVSGIVTDVGGMPLAGIPVLMRYRAGSGRIEWSSAMTGGAGDYAITFTSRPYVTVRGAVAARAEIMASEYEWYYRDVAASGTRLFESFLLQRRLVIAAGDSTIVDLAVGNGQCISGWMPGPCGRAHVRVPDEGSVTFTAMVNGVVAEHLLIEACCVDGNPVYGNPVTVPVFSGLDEITAEIGQKSEGVNTSQRVTLSTSISRF